MNLLILKVNLTGGSGNGFLVADKLAAYHTERGILLINAVECDPGLIHDAWIYRNQFENVEKGVQILDHIFHFRRKVLATKEPIVRNSNVFEQVKVKDRFPMGYENYLIPTVLQEEIPAGKHPTDVGILEMNLQTVLAIEEIVTGKQDGGERYFTVADIESAKAVVVKAKIGTKVEDVLGRVYGSRTDQMKKHIYLGSGAFSCHKVSFTDEITNQTGILAIGTMPNYEAAGKCKGCGRCNAVCPVGVSVSKIMKYVDQHGKIEVENCRIYHPDRCISCGACTYVCSAGKDTRGVVAWSKEK